MTDPVPVRFPPDVLEQVRAAAEADDRSVSSWIRRSVTRTLDAEHTSDTTSRSAHRVDKILASLPAFPASREWRGLSFRQRALPWYRQLRRSISAALMSESARFPPVHRQFCK